MLRLAAMWLRSSSVWRLCRSFSLLFLVLFLLLFFLFVLFLFFQYFFPSPRSGEGALTGPYEIEIQFVAGLRKEV
jgi:hypothetical protein